MTEPADWKPRYACCWCDREFIQLEIASRMAWVCPTPQCQERQLAWKMLDLNGALFYLPLPKQVELEEAIHSQQFGFICIGGPRAFGKSNTLRVINYRYVKSIENFEAYFIRREFPQLIKNHTRKAAGECKRLGLKWANMTATCVENNSFVEFSHCQDPDDYKNFIGAEADLLTFDQLEQFIRQQYTEISAAAGRKRRIGWTGLVLAGENPGGPLSAFVDELFISKSIDRKDYPQYRPERYHFIGGDLSDNPYCDPNYIDNLSMIEPVKRAMYRFGKRDVFPGQYFPTFVNDKRVQHVNVSADYPRIGGFHWGYFKSGIMLWAVVLPDGRLYIERELVFEETIAANVAASVLGDADVELANTFGNAPQDVPDAKMGETVFETLHRAGFTVARSEHGPVAGWQRLQHWLAVDGANPLSLIVDPSCVTVIKTLPQMIQAPNDIEDVDDGGATAAAKALRYLVMSRPNRLQPQVGPVGRDLSKVDDRTRRDIELMRAADARENDDHATYGRLERGWPFGASEAE